MALAISGGVLLFISQCSFHFLAIVCTKRINWIKFALIAISGALIGATWMASVGYWHLSWQLPESKIQQDVTINGVVVQGGCLNGQKLSVDAESRIYSYTVHMNKMDAVILPITKKVKLSHRTNARFKAHSTDHSAVYSSAQSNERQNNECLHNGDSFIATVKLKPAYGVLNPVGFNRQQYLTSQHIVATGYIKKLDIENTTHNHSTRHNISAFLSTLPLNQMRWFQALLIGERSLLTKEDWHTIGQTGTAHVFSISGMHLSVIAMAAFYSCNVIILILLLINFALKSKAGFVNFRTYVVFTVVISAAFYVMLSGMALPVVRAFILLTVGVGFAVFNKVLRPVNLGIFMLFTCILVFPLSLLQASFYLSVGAVISIWLLNWRFHFHAMPWYNALFCIQLGVSVVMAPISLLWFGTASVIGIIANMLVLPIVALILPIALLALLVGYFIPVSLSFSVWVLQKIDRVFTWVMALLTEAASYPLSAIHFYPSSGAMLCLLGAMLFGLLPYWRYKWVCMLLLVLPLFVSFIPASPSTWYVNVFDAGQGTAIAVTKGKHAVIIDTGPMYNGEAPLAGKVLPAFLAKTNSTLVDMVIHSHGDTDHAGGRQAFKAWLDSEGLNPSWISPVDGCERGKVTRWQGLTLSFLWPEKGNVEDSNAMSCVVKIDDGHRSVLFPGDIERTSEYAILQTEYKRGDVDDNVSSNTNIEPGGKNEANHLSVNADVLIAPHHGSKTSSTNIWIQKVSPEVVIYTQGYENRWKFPSKSVVSRYQEYGVRQFTTSEFGFIRLEFAKGGYIVSSERKHTQRRWYLPAHAPRHVLKHGSKPAPKSEPRHQLSPNFTDSVGVNKYNFPSKHRVD
ncbi:DNA internalization-related competence protein ComEC/Rec2 [Alteromonas sp. 1_MG-2023]|nr:DNA internalization-related competence protein ComEC/Rec2 [Alteromonas sp. 1_MG-2023]MDO6565999.1 DNA internalization-related competence protein ComEC/Rec2 [Alteromonas sp. 1_MG-2023]